MIRLWRVGRPTNAYMHKGVPLSPTESPQFLLHNPEFGILWDRVGRPPIPPELVVEDTTLEDRFYHRGVGFDITRKIRVFRRT